MGKKGEEKRKKITTKNLKNKADYFIVNNFTEYISYVYPSISPHKCILSSRRWYRNSFYLITINNQNNRCYISPWVLIPATRTSAKSIECFSRGLLHGKPAIHCVGRVFAPIAVRTGNEAKRYRQRWLKNFFINLPQVAICDGNYNVSRRDASTCLFSSVFFRE